MELHVLGSSSSGNCYILQNKDEALVIEAGVSLKEVKKAVDFNISKIVGVIVSHEHGDHAGHIQEFLNARIDVWLSCGTHKEVIPQSITGFMPKLCEAGTKFKMGNFTILPFDVKHDAAEPLGFLIKHEETGNVLFVTDSYFVPYTFANLSNILIEANYRTDLLQQAIDSGRMPTSLKNRTLESHMSLETCIEALRANDLGKVNNIVLIHLSDRNSNADEFKDAVHKATGKTVTIADKGVVININKTPF